MPLDQLKSTPEILSLYERRGERIPETKEFENLGIEDGAVFHDRLQAAGKKISEEALSFSPTEISEEVPFSVEIIDDKIPLVLLGALIPKHYRLGLHLIKPSSDDFAKMTDPKYLYENCIVHVDEKLRKGDIISEMAFFKRDENTWSQHHRKTYPKYSRQIDSTGVRVPMGKEMLEANEKIVALSAQQEGVTKTSLLEPAQVGVMRWAIQNGYAPATQKDAQLWERVQAGDSSFYIMDDYGNPDYVKIRNTPLEEDPTKDDLLRIKFEKKFYPKESKDGWDTAADVSVAVGNIIS